MIVKFLMLILVTIILIGGLILMGLIALCWKEIVNILRDKYREIRETAFDDFPKTPRT